MKKEIILFGIMAAVLVMFLGAASAVTPEKQVSNVESNKQSPSISNSKIVWADKRNGFYNIYVKDLTSTATEKAIDPRIKNQYDPDISGKNVVWTDMRTGTLNIYYKDLTSTIKALPVNPTNYQYDPSISGYKVVWQEWTSIGYRIRGYDLASDEPLNFNYSPAGCTESSPDINGNIVVFIRNQGSQSNLILYDLINQESMILTHTSFGRFSYPKIYGNDLVLLYTPYGATKSEVWNCKTNSGTWYKISSDASNCPPALYTNNVVWTHKLASGKTDIYLKNLTSSTQPVRKVCENAYNQLNPAIGGYPQIGYFVAWQDARTGLYKNSIFYRNMEMATPSVLSSTPRHGQSNFSRTATLLINFNKYLIPSTAYNQITVKNQSTNKFIPIQKAMKYGNLYIKTNARSPGNYYLVTIPRNAVKSFADNNLASNITIRFRSA